MRLRITSRTIIGFLVMAGVLVVADLLGIYYTDRLHDISERIVAENVTSFVAAKELQLALMDQKGLTTNFLLASDDAWLGRFEKASDSFYVWFAKAQQSAHTPAENLVLDGVLSAYETYLDKQRSVIALQKSGRFSEAQALLLGSMRTAFDAVSGQCEQLWDINERLLSNAEQRMAETNTRVNRIMYGVMIGGALLGLSLATVIARSITRPIYELVLKVRGVTQQEEETVQNVEITSANELEHLDRSVRLLIAKSGQINEELARNRDLLVRSERLASAGQLAAGIAHEIRNPLTTVKMLAFAVAEELTAEDRRRKDLQMMICEIERMEGVLQSFLDFARPPIPELAHLSLVQTVENAVTLLQPEMKKRGVRSIVTVPSEVTIHADRNQITQVLINLLMNALDAMPNGGELRIDTHTEESLSDTPGKMAVIEMADTGNGIPDNLLSTVFDPFVTGKIGGTGLGLSIAHKIIESHGGWVHAKNREEGGAVFVVALPVH